MFRVKNCARCSQVVDGLSTLDSKLAMHQQTTTCREWIGRMRQLACVVAEHVAAGEECPGPRGRLLELDDAVQRPALHLGIVLQIPIDTNQHNRVEQMSCEIV